MSIDGIVSSRAGSRRTLANTKEPKKTMEDLKEIQEHCNARIMELNRIIENLISRGSIS